MKLKLDADGHVVVVEGKPVYVHDDGKEVPFDAPGTVATITRLNGEAKGHREAKEAAETKLKAFDGLDAGDARKALETVANLDQGQLVTAGKVEELKAGITKAAEDKIAAATKAANDALAASNARADKAEGLLNNEMLSNRFSRSKFITDKVAVPTDIVQARFGSNFKIEDGKVVAYDQAGNQLYSRATPGQLADFDEALEILVDAYPYKDQILKGSGGSGTGKPPGQGGPGGGAKTMPRAEFEKLDPGAKAAKMKDGFTLVD